MWGLAKGFRVEFRNDRPPGGKERPELAFTQIPFESLMLRFGGHHILGAEHSPGSHQRCYLGNESPHPERFVQGVVPRTARKRDVKARGTGKILKVHPGDLDAPCVSVRRDLGPQAGATDCLLAVDCERAAFNAFLIDLDGRYGLAHAAK